MKYYKLKKDLPTFNKDELFYISDYGNLISCKDKNVIAYTATTLTKFPNILKDWFEPAPEPWRDEKTKEMFVSYLYNHKEERFFQAVRNFTRQYLKDGVTHVYASNPLDVADTFYWECDDMLKEEEEDGR